MLQIVNGTNQRFRDARSSCRNTCALKKINKPCHVFKGGGFIERNADGVITDYSEVITRLFCAFKQSALSIADLERQGIEPRRVTQFIRAVG